MPSVRLQGNIAGSSSGSRRICPKESSCLACKRRGYTKDIFEHIVSAYEDIYVVVQFFLPLFKTHYHTLSYITIPPKQRKIKFAPRIKLHHSIYMGAAKTLLVKNRTFKYN